MRAITTDRGNTYEVDYAWAPLADGSCLITMQDDRRLSVIASEFDGLQKIHFVDDETGAADWDGYSRLTDLDTIQPGKVRIKLVKGG